MCNRLTNSPTHNGQKPSTLCRIDPVEGAWKNPQNTSPEQKLKTKTKLTSNASQSSWNFGRGVRKRGLQLSEVRFGQAAFECFPPEHKLKWRNLIKTAHTDSHRHTARGVVEWGGDGAKGQRGSKPKTRIGLKVSDTAKDRSGIKLRLCTPLTESQSCTRFIVNSSRN